MLSDETNQGAVNKPDQNNQYQWHQEGKNDSEKGAQLTGQTASRSSSPQPSLSPVPEPPHALKGRTEIAKPPSLMPLMGPPVTVAWAKDWFDFCNAAGASACLYLPANTTFTEVFQGWVQDEDPLITDRSVCNYDGGDLESDGACWFIYPVSYYRDFIPTGALSTTASCDPPGTYVVDPKGAIKVDAHQSQSFTTGSTPITCVVQVWVYQ
jgi:hypothetical protein